MGENEWPKTVTQIDIYYVDKCECAARRNVQHMEESSDFRWNLCASPFVVRLVNVYRLKYCPFALTESHIELNMKPSYEQRWKKTRAHTHTATQWRDKNRYRAHNRERAKQKNEKKKSIEQIENNVRAFSLGKSLAHILRRRSGVCLALFFCPPPSRLLWTMYRWMGWLNVFRLFSSLWWRRMEVVAAAAAAAAAVYICTYLICHLIFCARRIQPRKESTKTIENHTRPAVRRNTAHQLVASCANHNIFFSAPHTAWGSRASGIKIRWKHTKHTRKNATAHPLWRRRFVISVGGRERIFQIK